MIYGQGWPPFDSVCVPSTEVLNIPYIELQSEEELICFSPAPYVCAQFIHQPIVCIVFVKCHGTSFPNTKALNETRVLNNYSLIQKLCCPGKNMNY